MGNNRLVRMDDMEGTNFSGLGSFGSAVVQFDRPWGVAAGTGGRIYAADVINNRIVSLIMP